MYSWCPGHKPKKKLDYMKSIYTETFIKYLTHINCNIAEQSTGPPLFLGRCVCCAQRDWLMCLSEKYALFQENAFFWLHNVHVTVCVKELMMKATAEKVY